MEIPKGDTIIVRMDETLSTNAKMKRLQNENPFPEGSMVMTEYQTAGRGQAGNSWYSGRSKNILLSVLLYPHTVKARDQFIISRIVSLALKKVLDKYITDVTIKWPNDIYWNNKKIAGILIENSLSGQHIDHTIVGIGLNVNEKEFPPALPNPISLRQITGAEIDREELLSSLHYELFKLYRLMKQDKIATIEQEYMQYLYRKDGLHWFVDENERFRASIKTIRSSGHIVLSTFPNNEEKTYAFKEVAFEVGVE